MQGPDISGQVAPPISGVTLAGKKINLMESKGKYVLVDFWASWCGPCRRANPKVVKIYNKYKDKDFEIISIGVEKSRTAWASAIQKDNLNWPNHILDTQIKGVSISDSYGVGTIPAKFLIDPAGVIIASNPSFGKIDRILSANLNNK